VEDGAALPGDLLLRYPRGNGTGSAAGDCLCGEDQEAIMSHHWRTSIDSFDVMRGTGDDETAYATGWTISGLATLGTIVAVWIFGM
jgi:hypothetical protein